MRNCALFPTTTLLHMRLMETGPAHDLQPSFRLMMFFKARRLTCPTTIHVHVKAESWRAAGKRKCARGYSASRAIRANVRNCAQLRPAVARNVRNCEPLCANAPSRFAQHFLMRSSHAVLAHVEADHVHAARLTCSGCRLPGWNFKLGLCCTLHLHRQHEVPSRCDFNAGPALALKK